MSTNTARPAHRALSADDARRVRLLAALDNALSVCDEVLDESDEDSELYTDVRAWHWHLTTYLSLLECEVVGDWRRLAAGLSPFGEDQDDGADVEPDVLASRVPA